MIKLKGVISMKNNRVVIIKTINFRDLTIKNKKIALNDLRSKYVNSFIDAVEGLYALDLKILSNKINNSLKELECNHKQNTTEYVKLKEVITKIDNLNFIHTFDDFKNADGVSRLLAWSLYPTKNLGFSGSEDLAMTAYKYYLKDDKTVDDTSAMKKVFINYINKFLGENTNFKLDKINNATLNKILYATFIKSVKVNQNDISIFEQLRPEQIKSCHRKLIQQLILFTIAPRVGCCYKPNKKADTTTGYKYII